MRDVVLFHWQAFAYGRVLIRYEYARFCLSKPSDLAYAPALDRIECIV